MLSLRASFSRAEAHKLSLTRSKYEKVKLFTPFLASLASKNVYERWKVHNNGEAETDISVKLILQFSTHSGRI